MIYPSAIRNVETYILYNILRGKCLISEIYRLKYPTWILYFPHQKKKYEKFLGSLTITVCCKLFVCWESLHYDCLNSFSSFNNLLNLQFYINEYSVTPRKPRLSVMSTRKLTIFRFSIFRILLTKWFALF